MPFAARTVAADAGRDGRLALRALRRRPGFAILGLVTLALGIGAPTAVFSVVHAVLLRPLPYPDADRIVRFRMEGTGPNGPLAFDAMPVSTVAQWRANSSTLAEVALFNDRALTLSSSDGPVRLAGASATPNLFDLLGVAPAIGRTFGAADAHAREIVLSYRTWQRYFGGDPAIAGRTIVLDGGLYDVTGVMPEGFTYPTPEAAFWVPQDLAAGGQRGMLLPTIARIRPDATVAAVVAEGRRMTAAEGSGPATLALKAETLQEQMVGGARRGLWVLMAAVATVFVIATVNIALLLLTRGAGRAREFAVRLAIGAPRSRLIRQLFAEGLALAVLGGVAGVALAGATLTLFVRLAPGDLPRLHEASIDGPVLLFTLASTLVTSLIFGLLSAGRTVAFDQIRALAGSGESRLAGRRTHGRRLHALAAAEIAMTMVLLVGAGLLLRSFVALVRVPQGFDAKGSLALQVNLPAARYPSANARMAFLDRLLERVRAVRGTSAAGLATSMPNRQPTGRFDYNAIGVPLFVGPGTMPTSEVRMVSEGFLEAFGMPLVAGRQFVATDTAGAEPVIVISEALAKQQFAGRDPIGQTLYSRTGNRRVIGVVGNVRPAVVVGTESSAVYLPLRQEVDVLDWWSTVSVVLRAERPSALAPSLRTLVLSLDPEMPPFNVRALEDEVSALVAGPRFTAGVLALFAGIALVMAAVGVYGVMSHGAGQRRQEIGLRVALGATTTDVLRLMMRDGLLDVITGVAGGLIASVWLARSLTSLLHDVAPADPAALVSVGALLAVVGLLAAFVPAWRATRVSALVTLRRE